MTMTSTTLAGRYVYAFVRDSAVDAILEKNLTGINDCPLSSETQGGIAAIVSEIAPEKIRPRRQLLAAHQNIVTTISSGWDMLPVSFGLIADDTEDLQQILAANAEVLSTQLDRVGGQVEMNLVISWNTENVFQYFVEKQPQLLSARDAIAAGTASRDDMIEIGRLFEQLLAAEREQHGATVLEIIAPVCKETELQDPRSEKELVRLNCLISREGEEQFTQAIHKAAEAYNEDYAFNFSGPWPPYSFVNLSLSVE